MLFMEQNLDFGGAWWGTGVKVLADQTVWSLYLNAMYSFIIGTLALRPIPEVWREVKVSSWPALRTSWRFWPFVHTISFSHAVPLDLKLLWVDCVEVVWVILLSKIANDDKDLTLAIEDSAAVGNTPEDALNVEPLTLIAVDTVDQNTLDSSQKEKGFLELQSAAWRAAWPLAAMWPVVTRSSTSRI
mmetsp:Transcript_26109/g.58504  ORF Transcript_26109/g.58504 Transcript_26109/m.58504 type:complete len:187 (+) Transcript_26109:315-875(+)